MTITATDLIIASRYQSFVDVVPVAAEVASMLAIMYNLATANGLTAGTNLDARINVIVCEYIESRYPLAEPVNLQPLRPIANLEFTKQDIINLKGATDLYRSVWIV